MEIGAFIAGLVVGAVATFFVMKKHGAKLMEKAGGGPGEPDR